MLALVSNLIGLLVQVYSQVVELLFSEGRRGLFGVAIRLFGSEPVGDPDGTLLVGSTTSLGGWAVVAAEDSCWRI